MPKSKNTGYQSRPASFTVVLIHKIEFEDHFDPINQESEHLMLWIKVDWLSSLNDSAASLANLLKNTSTVYSDGTVTSGGTSAI